MTTFLCGALFKILVDIYQFQVHKIFSFSNVLIKYYNRHFIFFFFQNDKKFISSLKSINNNETVIISDVELNSINTKLFTTNFLSKIPHKNFN